MHNIKEYMFTRTNITVCLKLDIVFQHYEKDADGLCTQLKQPLEKKGNFEFAVDKQAFVDQGWVIKFKDLKLGEAIGKGEFAGSVSLV